MPTSNPITIPAEFLTLRTEIFDWRKAQNGVRRVIPERFWRDALLLAGTHGGYKTAAFLGLPSGSMHRRLKVLSAVSTGKKVANTPLRFVDIPIPLAKPTDAIIELLHDGGEKLMIRVPSSEAAGVAAELWQAIQ